MKQIFTVMNSDAINRYGMKFPVSVLENGLRHSWQIGIPMLLSHDIHRPVGWNRPLGLYLEPGLTRLVGIILLPENTEEQQAIYESHNSYLAKKQEENCALHEDSIRQHCNEYLMGHEQCISAETVALFGSGIAERLFPELFNDRDKDGLISLDLILDKFVQVGPGVFRHKQKDLALFAHHYFRKSLSRYNNFNRFFLENFLALSINGEGTKRIALDCDLIGLASTYRMPIELEYWWGPKFNEDIEKIEDGVTMHVADEYSRLFFGISKTEFWWKSDKANRIFEAEELKEIPSFGISGDSFGCRYVHAMFNTENGSFHHFDGAIRMYSTQEMREREERDIKKAGKYSQYTKLFRIDGHLQINTWKTLISHFFQGNLATSEYFGEERAMGLEPTIMESNQTSNSKSVFCPYSIQKNMGVRLFISYHQETEEMNEIREIASTDTFTIEDVKYNIIEHDVIELRKALKTLDDDVQIPRNITLIACEDLYLNLPIIHHNKNHLPQNLQNTLEAVRLLACSLKNRNSNHVFSFTAAWPLENQELRISIFGQISDICDFLEEFADKIPVLKIGEIGDWAESVAEWLTAKYPKAIDRPSLAEIVQASGVLWINRSLLSDGILCRSYYDKEKRALMHEIAIPRNKKQLIEAIENESPEVALAFIVNSSLCSKCKSEYITCPHSKWLEGDVTQLMKDFLRVSAFWTDRKA
jgi:hypothetical protein